MKHKNKFSISCKKTVVSVLDTPINNGLRTKTSKIESQIALVSKQSLLNEPAANKELLDSTWMQSFDIEQSYAGNSKQQSNLTDVFFDSEEVNTLVNNLQPKRNEMVEKLEIIPIKELTLVNCPFHVFELEEILELD